MSKVFQEDEAMIFVDASKAFNNLNQQSTLLNVMTLCPSLAPILTRTEPFISGQSLLSKEGTTQGDPLAMAMYAIGTKPLMNGIAKQVWYADDSGVSSWIGHGEYQPMVGYYPNSLKSLPMQNP